MDPGALCSLDAVTAVVVFATVRPCDRVTTFGSLLGQTWGNITFLLIARREKGGSLTYSSPYDDDSKNAAARDSTKDE